LLSTNKGNQNKNEGPEPPFTLVFAAFPSGGNQPPHRAPQNPTDPTGAVREVRVRPGIHQFHIPNREYPLTHIRDNDEYLGIN
jgi:hypothetical protein